MRALPDKPPQPRYRHEKLTDHPSQRLPRIRMYKTERLSRPDPTRPESGFVRRMDDRTLKRIADVDAIEAAVHHIGHILVDLYFRFVHLYWALVRILTPETPPSLYATILSVAREKLQGAIQLPSSVSLEHTAAF
ncbi:hypothetical protein F5B19DRAFT_497441 [Rostrohypoxylon terebratum]|nr:hypothetical protein F5B19DRAFT_497441 [Rostrohypoxylon terebratum]